MEPWDRESGSFKVRLKVNCEPGWFWTLRDVPNAGGIRRSGATGTLRLETFFSKVYSILDLLLLYQCCGHYLHGRFFGLNDVLRRQTAMCSELKKVFCAQVR